MNTTQYVNNEFQWILYEFLEIYFITIFLYVTNNIYIWMQTG